MDPAACRDALRRFAASDQGLAILARPAAKKARAAAPDVRLALVLDKLLAESPILEHGSWVAKQVKKVEAALGDVPEGFGAFFDDLWIDWWETAASCTSDWRDPAARLQVFGTAGERRHP